MASILTTKEVSEYLRLHEITICKYAAEGLLPAIRIGRVWRFDKEKLDEWMANGCKIQKEEEKPSNGGKRKKI